jgi:hypothetical protein
VNRDEWTMRRAGLHSRVTDVIDEMQLLIDELSELGLIGPDDRAVGDAASSLGELEDQVARLTFEQSQDPSMPPDEMPRGPRFDAKHTK